MSTNEVINRRMKKTAVLLGSLLLISVLLFIIARSGAGSSDDLIDQMISDYGKGQEKGCAPDKKFPAGGRQAVRSRSGAGKL